MGSTMDGTMMVALDPFSGLGPPFAGGGGGSQKPLTAHPAPTAGSKAEDLQHNMCIQVEALWRGREWERESNAAMRCKCNGRRAIRQAGAGAGTSRRMGQVLRRPVPRHLLGWTDTDTQTHGQKCLIGSGLVCSVLYRPDRSSSAVQLHLTNNRPANQPSRTRPTYQPAG